MEVRENSQLSFDEADIRIVIKAATGQGREETKGVFERILEINGDRKEIVVDRAAALLINQMIQESANNGGGAEVRQLADDLAEHF